MSNSEPAYESLQLVGLHVPDESFEQNPDGTRTTVALPGLYKIGAVIRGVFVPIEVRKAAGLFADIARVEQAAKDQQAAADTTTTPAE